MLLTRTLVTLALLPIGLAAIYFGGFFYYLVISVFIVLAAFEYIQLFRTGGYQPAGALVVLGVIALITGRALDQGGFRNSPMLVSALVLLVMTYHLFAYERGRDLAATDFCISLVGILYLGWIGAYLVSLRSITQGRWWVLVVLASVWFADSGAYLIGSRFGKHKMSPRLSPKKTWEGYWGGVAFGVIGGLALGYILPMLFGQEAAGIFPLRGALVGLVIAVLTTLGDLGESMIKRQVGAKDSGKFLPGHGGAFDRIDSWLWAAVLGYYLITWLWVTPML